MSVDESRAEFLVRQFFEIRDDKIYALREYMDTAYILKQLEMEPA